MNRRLVSAPEIGNTVALAPPTSEGNRRGGRSPSGRAMALMLAATLGGGMLAGCTVENNTAIDPYIAACDEGNGRLLPSAANAGIVVDDRMGDVFSCEYFLDMRVPFNAPTKLNQISEEEFASDDFTVDGSLGGFAILGTGGIGAGISAEGHTTRYSQIAVKFTDLDGYTQTVRLDSEEVRIAECGPGCVPTIEFVLSDVPLFQKERDNGWHDDDTSSIWTAQTNDDGRGRVVSSVSHCSEAPGYDYYCLGGPQSTDNVISALASQILITVPSYNFVNR